ncbi:MAG: hypothetical protein JO143_01875 [Acetobacteraceae bacterium]|nr:hypothetical protein [Acetobacteraceae bacterium]
MDKITSGWIPMLSLQLPQLVYVALLSVLIPLSIFVARRNVRIRRLRLLTSWEDLLRPLAKNGALPACFTAIKARYLDGTEGRSFSVRLSAWAKEIAIYALPTLVFALVSACGFALLFSLGGKWLEAAQVLLQGLPANDKDPESFRTATALVLGAGFVGAYIWSVNYLVLRIANFDLSPLDFLSTSAHVLITVFAAWVLRQVVAAPGPSGLGVAAVLLIAFLSGLYPALGVNVLVDRLPGKDWLKRDIKEAPDIKRSFPLDLVDGIDTTVKFRLNGLDIADAQNLATANPVELFVETPYGFAQILDWVAQAQLLTELGPQGFLRARGAGIRDIVCLLDMGKSEAGRTLIRPLLGADNEADDTLRVRIDSLTNKLYVCHLTRWIKLLTQAIGDPSKGTAKS